MHTHLKEVQLAELLRLKGFRATRSRVHLLALLQKVGRPLSIQHILSLWKESAPDQTTLYRSLADLCKASIVRRIDLNTGIAHFEYTPDRPHHHHIVCTDCGAIEEIDACPMGMLSNKILEKSALFEKTHEHHLEFFGHCIACTLPTKK